MRNFCFYLEKKADENSIERAVKVLDDLWNDSSVAVNESSNIASKFNDHRIDLFVFVINVFFYSLENVFQTLALNSDRERLFNERLLICLGFVKVKTKELKVRYLIAVQFLG